MAKYAYRVSNGTENDKIDAAMLPLHGNGIFYCTTPGCKARMHVRSPQKTSACFVSYDISEHTGGTICHLKDRFKPDQYDENFFSLERLYNNLLTKRENDISSLYGTGGKGNNQRIAINTLKMLYLMCIQYRDGKTYNGYPIEDILVDKYNFEQYLKHGIVGNRVVSCTFWKYASDTNHIFMNCPDELLHLDRKKHQHLKIYVHDDEMFKKCVHKLYDKTHSKLSVIVANWKETTDYNCLAECELFSVGKQICKGD